MTAVSLRLGVVVAEDVEDAVHDEQRELVVERAGVLGRLARGHRRAHHDVAEQQRLVARVGRRAVGAAVARRRRRHHVDVDGVDREGEHVGRAVVAEELLVEGGDVVLLDEQQAQLDVAPHALGGQHRLAELAPPGDVDRHRALLVGDEHLGVAVAAHLLPAAETRPGRLTHAGSRRAARS